MKKTFSIKSEMVVTEDGIKIAIRHLNQKRNSVVIVAPGFFQSKETKTFKAIQEDLFKTVDVISMDFRGHGKSHGFYTFSAKEHYDLNAVIDYAEKHYDHVGVLGFSYGGSIAIITNHLHKNIDSIVCVGSPMASEEIEFNWWAKSTMNSGRRSMEKGIGFRPGNPFLNKMRPIDLLGKDFDAPVCFIHGESDQIVYTRHSELMFEKVQTRKKIEIFKAGGHAEDLHRTHQEPFVSSITQWFSSTLRNGINPINFGYNTRRGVSS